MKRAVLLCAMLLCFSERAEAFPDALKTEPSWIQPQIYPQAAVVSSGLAAALPGSCVSTGLGQIYFATDTTTAYYCVSGTYSAGGGGGSVAFSSITAGTNAAALLVGTGGSLGTSGSGTITATALLFSGLTGATNTTAAMLVGTGASLGVTGSGTITATAAPFSGISAGTNANALVIGTGGSLAVSGSGTITATAVPFSGVSAATNANALVIGTGGSLTISGSGTINATSVNSNTFPASAGLTSGGVICATGISAYGVSALMTTNVLIKGGGAGACPAVSLATDNATTLTYTGTGGVSAPSYTATGATAGFLDLPQGSTSVAVAGCATANSICMQAPISVTSYLITRAGAAATGIPHYANASSVITETISAIALNTADVTGQLPIGSVGSSGLSGTAPITISAAGAIACATCVTSAASLANGGLVLGTAGTQASATNTALTFVAPTLTVGLAGTSSGILSLTGSTSGNITITAPATAGTSTNAITVSNSLQLASGTVYAISTDVGISRDAAGILDFGNATAGNATAITRSGNTVTVASNFTTASTSLVTITGLSWTFPATAHNYSFYCKMSYSQATAAAANAFGVQAATTAPTNLYAAMRVSTGLAITGVDATLPTLATTTATNIGTFTPSAAGAIGTVADIFTADLWGYLEQGAGATTLNIMALTGSASDSLTIYRGSSCFLSP